MEEFDEDGLPILPAKLRPFRVNANEAICFKLVRKASDIDDDETSFQPELTHQVFGESEHIFGYKNLEIDLYTTACSLDFYFNMNFEAKVKPTQAEGLEADDVTKLLFQWLPSSISRKGASNIDTFVEKVKKQHLIQPFGDQLFEYSRQDKKQQQQRNFTIHKVTRPCDNAAYVEWHKKLESYLVFFIDAFSPIDLEDPNWTVYLLYEKYEDEEGRTCHAIIGFATVYLYYAYFDKTRPRVSQVLIFPPYQRRGHGVSLLTTIYMDFRGQDNILDITAEDPADEFVALRDVVTVELCQTSMPELFSRDAILERAGRNELKLKKEEVEQVRRLLKITPRQTERVNEICVLQVTNIHDEQELKRFRLFIKQRLYAPIRLNTTRRRRQALDPAYEALVTDEGKRKTFLQSQYEQVLTEYEAVLAALEKRRQRL